VPGIGCVSLASAEFVFHATNIAAHYRYEQKGIVEQMSLSRKQTVHSLSRWRESPSLRNVPL